MISLVIFLKKLINLFDLDNFELQVKLLNVVALCGRNFLSNPKLVERETDKTDDNLEWRHIFAFDELQEKWKQLQLFSKDLAGCTGGTWYIVTKMSTISSQKYWTFQSRSYFGAWLRPFSQHSAFRAWWQIQLPTTSVWCKLKVQYSTVSETILLYL